VIGGLWAAGWIARWVGTQWLGARPAVIFWLLQWVVMIACVLAVVSVFRWWGRRASESTQDGWFGGVDRAAGVVLGAGVGMLIVTFLFLAALLAPWPSRVAETASHARLAAPLMHGGATTCRRVGDAFPGSTWLRSRFLAARARAWTAETAV
jgi:hypothetical protein